MFYCRRRRANVGTGRHRCVPVHSFASKRVCIMDARSRPSVAVDLLLHAPDCFIFACVRGASVTVKLMLLGCLICVIEMQQKTIIFIDVMKLF